MVNLITGHMDIWTAAQTQKNNVGRGRGKNSNGQNAHGIKKLRELILELAVRGKLVPQDPNDEPASVLLEKIAKEKERLIKEGKIKKQKNFQEISENEKKYEIPKSWEWTRLTNIYYPISPSGKKLKSSEIRESGEFPVVDQGKSHIAGYTDDASLLIEIPGPVIVFGDHTTERKYIDFNFVAGADGTKILRPFKMDERYFHTYLLSYKLENRGYARHFKVLNDNLVALPPLSEQHRIVAKVDELMALCDQLEQQQTDSNDTHQTLVEALLAALTNAADQRGFAKAWQRIANHFDTLFTTEQSIDQLKQTILQLAVMGKLVLQDSSDEPASVLLEKIAKEKKWLVKEGKIKKQKPLPEISEDEKSFELPNGWERATLSHFGVFSGGKTPSKAKSIYWDGDIPWVTPKDMKVVNIFDTEDHVTSMAIDDGLSLYDPDAILFVVRSGILRHSFPVAVAKVSFTVNQDLKVLSLFRRELSPYIYLMMRGFEQYILENLTKTGMTVESVVFDKFSKHYFMLPPFTEQQRIVAKVDELMAICDTLKDRLNDAQTTQVQLADSIVERAVA